MTKQISEPCSPAEQDLLDYCNELMGYKNELADRINILSDAILALDKRMKNIENMVIEITAK